MLKAVHCQVNEIHQDQRPSCSMSTIRRSTVLRSNRHPAKAVLPTSIVMSRCLSRGEPGATTSITIANMTKKSNRMFECTSTIFEMHDDVSMNSASVAMKKKYAAARSTSKSTVIRTQL